MNGAAAAAADSSSLNINHEDEGESLSTKLSRRAQLHHSFCMIYDKYDRWRKGNFKFVYPSSHLERPGHVCQILKATNI